MLSSCFYFSNFLLYIFIDIKNNINMEKFNIVMNLIDSQKIIDETKKFVNNLTLALSQNRLNTNKYPTIKERNSIKNRIDHFNQWIFVNEMIRLEADDKEKKIASMLTTFPLSQFYDSDDMIYSVFNQMRNKLKLKLNESPTLEKNSEEWCISRLFDATREMLLNFETYLNKKYEKKNKEQEISIDNTVLLEDKKKEMIINEFSPHYNSLSIIMENPNQLMKEISQCNIQKKYLPSFSQLYSNLSPTLYKEKEKQFNEFIKGIISNLDKYVQAKKGIGQDIYLICKEKIF